MLGDVFFTVILATLATLAFESPIVVLEKILFKKHRQEVRKEEEPTLATRSNAQLIANEESAEVIVEKGSTSHL